MSTPIQARPAPIIVRAALAAITLVAGSAAIPALAAPAPAFRAAPTQVPTQVPTQAPANLAVPPASVLPTSALEVQYYYAPPPRYYGPPPPPPPAYYRPRYWHRPPPVYYAPPPPPPPRYYAPRPGYGYYRY